MIFPPQIPEICHLEDRYLVKLIALAIPEKSTYAKITLEVERATIIDLSYVYRPLGKILLEGLSTQHPFFFLILCVQILVL